MTVRFGLVARADDRGLGLLTWEWYRALQPDRVLVVREPGAEGHGFTPHLARYPDATVVHYEPGVGLPEQACRDWLAGLDVVYGAETWYDARWPGWAADAGTRAVLHAMPEFYRPEMAATEVWNPTPWRHDTLPDGARVVPVPVAADRFPMAPPAPHQGPLRVLHVAGRRAAGDRNGTLQLLQALRHVRRPMRIRLMTQDARMPRAGRVRSAAATVEVRTGGVADYWRLYDDADVLVMPRRYGGLCLPVQEAMAAGLAVVMTACPPNDWWPVLPVDAVQRGALATPAGEVPMWAAHPPALGRALDQLAADRDLLAARQRASVGWAEAHSWQALAAQYRVLLLQAGTPAAA